MKKVLIVGKPNVGKSSLFNRLVGGRRSIVDDVPGVTRDAVYGIVEWQNKRFEVVDTCGLFSEPKDIIEKEMWEITLSFLDDADLVLFIVDGKHGITSEDLNIADLLRKKNIHVLLVANKVENKEKFLKEVLPDVYALGFGEPMDISVIHAKNIDILLDKIVEILRLEPEIETEKQIDENQVKIALVGKPNVGKSSLFNEIIGKNRSMVTPIPGTTRDAIDEVFEFSNFKYRFIDTAGIRKKSAVRMRTIESYSILRSVRAIEKADVAVLIIDSTVGITSQDQKIAGLIERKGKASIIVFNKVDLIDRLQREYLKSSIKEKLYFIDYSPLIFTSTVTKEGLNKLLKTIKMVYESYTKRIPTSALNAAIERMMFVTPTPTVRGKKVKLFYGTQVDIKPPTFLFFSNFPQLIPESYKRNIRSTIRNSIYQFPGSPLFLKFKARG
ncbi:MAG: ribosome biogenesis GTPase Der [Thermotogae bacterium]|nr:ribosome biogenesis GTPase Der [Thermotogota bacterium]